MDSAKVLIVDDEIDLRELISFDFETAGFETATAENGKIALELLQSEHFDVIISDIRMPVMDGIELLKEVRKSNQDIIVVFITGFSDISTEDALECGVDQMFYKPFDRRQLLSSIKNLLKPKRNRWRDEPTHNFDFNLVLKLKSYKEAEKNNSLKLTRGGMFVALDKAEAAVGSILSFKIHIEEDQLTLQGQAIVRWVRPVSQDGHTSGLGLEFLHLSEETIEFVLQALEKKQFASFSPKA